MKVKLADVCTCESSNLKQSDVINILGKYPVYGATGKIGYIDTYKQEKPYIAIVKDGAGIGRTHLCDSKSSVIGTLQYILPKDNVLPEYLFYVIKHMHLEKYYSGATIPHIYFKNYKNEEFNLDSINKQETIINILNDCNKLINLKETQLQKYDDLIKARFVEMFGDPQTNQFNWNKVNISKIVKGKVSNGYFAKRNEYCADGNVNILGVANIVNRMYSNVKDLPRTNASQKDIAKFKVQYGDMLFCRSSLVADGIGKSSIIPKDIADNILFECHVIRLPLDLNQCVPEFVQVLSTTDFFRNQVISQSKTATMTTIGQDGILKTDIILPPIYKQKEFESFVKQVDKSKFHCFHQKIRETFQVSQKLTFLLKFYSTCVLWYKVIQYATSIFRQRLLIHIQEGNEYHHLISSYIVP